MTRIETARLMLRDWRRDDVDAVVPIFNDEGVMRHMGMTRGRAWIADRISLRMQHQERFGFSMWAVEHKRDGAVIGQCGIQHLDYDPDEDVEIGWLLAKRYWRKGLATEAATASLDHGFDVLGLERIVAITLPENAASQALMRKLGMRLEREDAWYYGALHVLYAITREEWHARRRG